MDAEGGVAQARAAGPAPAALGVLGLRCKGCWDQGGLNGAYRWMKSLLDLVVHPRSPCARLLLTCVLTYAFITLWLCNP